MEHCGLSHILQEPDKYNPDTLDLLVDDEAREYWLNTCERLVERNVNYALANTDDPTVEIRALKYKTCYVEALKELRVNPVAHGQLTIRLLLDINETCLRSQGFFDLWKLQKKFDNERALAVFSSRLAEIDAIPNDRQRWIELCRGVLAGLSSEMKMRGVDLIILEGMGRAVHTNFKRVNTIFAVDSLKLAVVKNAWLAQRLGGPLFSVIFIYEDKPIQTKP
ncbi:hypothetical protein MSG28_000444 [Choristoneura fumiferana]|uniref:Uncharacterized protein n=1 Tax=Choristoneura fumiferana TaxID=7141 RepID=A0ACC0K1E5_CHOFU|nr:hypothetical protein MSG28_000444 [Choristoneura fumiferana]